MPPKLSIRRDPITGIATARDQNGRFAKLPPDVKRQGRPYDPKTGRFIKTQTNKRRQQLERRRRKDRTARQAERRTQERQTRQHQKTLKTGLPAWGKTELPKAKKTGDRVEWRGPGGRVISLSQAKARFRHLERRDAIQKISKTTGISTSEVAKRLKGLSTQDIVGKYRGYQKRYGRVIRDPPSKEAKKRLKEMGIVNLSLDNDVRDAESP